MAAIVDVRATDNRTEGKYNSISFEWLRPSEGVKDPFGGLGLVLNMIVLWNTIYMVFEQEEHMHKSWTKEALSVLSFQRNCLSSINKLNCYFVFLS
jgi:hypothetical protein